MRYREGLATIPSLCIAGRYDIEVVVQCSIKCGLGSVKSVMCCVQCGVGWECVGVFVEFSIIGAFFSSQNNHA